MTNTVETVAQSKECLLLERFFHVWSYFHSVRSDWCEWKTPFVARDSCIPQSFLSGIVVGLVFLIWLTGFTTCGWWHIGVRNFCVFYTQPHIVDPIICYEIFCGLRLLEFFQFYCSLWRIHWHEVSVSLVQSHKMLCMGVVYVVWQFLTITPWENRYWVAGKLQGKWYDN